MFHNSSGVSFDYNLQYVMQNRRLSYSFSAVVKNRRTLLSYLLDALDATIAVSSTAVDARVARNPMCCFGRLLGSVVRHLARSDTFCCQVIQSPHVASAG